MATKPAYAFRMNCWTPEQDHQLASIVLNQIESGGTQLQAFQVAAQQLKRTPGACGFRWNGVLRQTYTKEIQVAKKNRKRRSRQAIVRSGVIASSSTAIQEVIRFLVNIDSSYLQLQHRVEELTQEITKLKKRLQDLGGQEHNFTLPPEEVDKDTKALKYFFERASQTDI